MFTAPSGLQSPAPAKKSNKTWQWLTGAFLFWLGLVLGGWWFSNSQPKLSPATQSVVKTPAKQHLHRLAPSLQPSHTHKPPTLGTLPPAPKHWLSKVPKPRKLRMARKNKSPRMPRHRRATQKTSCGFLCRDVPSSMQPSLEWPSPTDRARETDWLEGNG